LKYADIALEEPQDISFSKVVFTRAKRIGDLERIYRYAKEIEHPLVSYYEITYINAEYLSEIQQDLKNDVNYNVDISFFVLSFILVSCSYH